MSRNAIIRLNGELGSKEEEAGKLRQKLEGLQAKYGILKESLGKAEKENGKLFEELKQAQGRLKNEGRGERQAHEHSGIIM